MIHFMLNLAEPAPSSAWENSMNCYFCLSLSLSTTYFTPSMCLDLITHFMLSTSFPLTIFVITFGTGWSGYPPPLPSSRQWWQQAASRRVKPQLGLPGLSSSLSASTTPSLPCSIHRKLLITGTTQLSLWYTYWLAIPIGIAIYDLWSKCNIWPRFWPQNSLIMQLWIPYVLPVDPKVWDAKNEPDLWRTESTRGAQTYTPEQLYIYRFPVSVWYH